MKNLIVIVVSLIFCGTSMAQTKSDSIIIDIVSFDSLQKMGYQNVLDYNDSILTVCFGYWEKDSVLIKTKLSNVKDNYIIIARTLNEEPLFSQDYINQKIESINELIGITEQEKQIKFRKLMASAVEDYNNKNYSDSKEKFMKAIQYGYPVQEIKSYLEKIDKKLEKQKNRK